MKLLTYILSIFILTSVASITSCKKKVTFSSDGIEFTKDSVIFDTIFTTVGSTTLNFRIKNNSNNPVQINEISLMGGSNSNFRINVDGISGDIHQDVTIPAKDSLYTFVEVTLDPNNQNNPLIIEDSIRFLVNGEYSYVVLAAWGQDAYFHYNDVNEGVWPNDKPHVVYGFAGIDSAKNLVIQQGTDVYLHKNSLLYVYKGSVDIQGTKDFPVTFQGDRLEAFYDDVAGQYYGLYFEEARTSTINHAIIKNGTAGIHIFGNADVNTDYTVKVSNTQIYNNASYGLFNFRGGNIFGENLSIYKNGTYGYFHLVGGNYFFKQSNLLSYGGNASVAAAIKNYYTDPNDNTTYVSNINEGVFYNSILDAGGDYSFGFDTINPDNSLSFNFEFDYTSLKAEEIPQDDRFTNILWNSSPGFVDVNADDYHLGATSPLINAGNTAPTHTNNLDIENNPRNGVPDLGAYEFQ